MNIEYLRRNNLIIFECISGSRSYGLELPGSDLDIRGVFIYPQEKLYGFDYNEQVANESNDVVFYELKKFFWLLLKNNPNILELLNIPADCIIYKHPLIDRIHTEIFLSRLCCHTFANYAFAQIKKAKGLNKKIVNPVDKERKSVLDFCYVLHEQGSLPLKAWMEKNNILHEHCGLVNIPHFRDTYALYYEGDKSTGYRGIVSKENSNDVALSSVGKGAIPLVYMQFNKDGYSIYCKEYKAYWEWVDKRNDLRYENTLTHGKNYDAKNMQHVFRLLNMADEIALEKKINTKRPDREFLLKVRSGAFEYEELLQMANEKMRQVKQHFEESDLPETPAKEQIERLMIDIRKDFYNAGH